MPSTEQLCCFELVSLLTVASGNSREIGSVFCILTCVQAVCNNHWGNNNIKWAHNISYIIFIIS